MIVISISAMSITRIGSTIINNKSLGDLPENNFMKAHCWRRKAKALGGSQSLLAHRYLNLYTDSNVDIKNGDWRYISGRLSCSPVKSPDPKAQSIAKAYLKRAARALLYLSFFFSRSRTMAAEPTKKSKTT